MTPTNPTENDVVDLLTADHHEALQLCEQIPGAVVEERRDLADLLIAELVRHSVAEETVVYPVMRNRLPDGDQVVEHDIEEHQELEASMRTLEGVDPKDPEFEVSLARLEGLLRHHAEDEQGEQFPRLRAEISVAELQAMAEQVQAIKKVAPTRPHPAAPNNPLFHLTVGPGVGLVDRLRDTLSGRATSSDDVATTPEGGRRP